MHAEPHESTGQTRDAPRLVPDHGSDDPGDRAREARGGPGARQRADRRGPSGADDVRPARPPEPAPRAPPALARLFDRGAPDFLIVASRLAARRPPRLLAS